MTFEIREGKEEYPGYFWINLLPAFADSLNFIFKNSFMLESKQENGVVVAIRMVDTERYQMTNATCPALEILTRNVEVSGETWFTVLDYQVCWFILILVLIKKKNRTLS